MVMECKVTARKSHYPKDVPFDVPEGWQWCKISDVVDKLTDGTHNSPKSYPSGAYMYVTAKNIKKNGLDLSNITYVTEDIHREIYSRCNPQKGDILYIKDGATCGISTINNLDEEFSLLSSVALIKPNKSVLNTYINLFLQSDFCYRNVRDSMKGVGITRIILKQMELWDIPLPPYAEQKRIVTSAEQLLQLIETVEVEQLVLKKEIKKTKERIIALAIHGKLVPQDPKEEPAIESLKRINPAFKSSYNLHYGERLPNGWTCGLFGELNQHRNKSEDPLSFPDKEYELYSVPIYETGMPEFLHGKEIGSTKQIVDKGDVLLCKINPHLNRSWVVSHYRPELKCIASSEWLIFNNAAVIPDYARLFFMSPSFKELMLSNVSGVGGSLMRARASAVNNYPIWIPPINEQMRIIQTVCQLNATIESIVSILE